MTRGACCSSPRPSRPAIWRSSGGRRSGSGSPSRPRSTVGSDGLLDLSAGVVFRHPLARSAVYRAATADERSEAHLALGDATVPDVDPDRRAWHRAQATSMPDEDVAVELEHSAARAQARGGFAAAAAFLERSSVLTLDPARRVARALAAAQAKHEAGAFDEALALAADAEAGPLDGVQRAEVDLLRAQISFAANARQRGAGAAAHGRQAARAARRSTGAGDLPRRAVRRPVRGSSGGARWCPRGRAARGEARARAATPPARGGSAPRRPGQADHRGSDDRNAGLRRRCAPSRTKTREPITFSAGGGGWRGEPRASSGITRHGTP